MDLAGQLLIAMPDMGDPRFARSVVLICEYSASGAMGLILNKPVPDMPLAEVLERLEIAERLGPVRTPVQYGGPVETGRGFVLHRDVTRAGPEPMAVPGDFVVTATRDILEDLARGAGPAPFIFVLGYSGWGPGQLEGEIAQNGWLTAPAAPDLVFSGDPASMWEKALRSIGIDPLSLSAAPGAPRRGVRGAAQTVIDRDAQPVLRHGRHGDRTAHRVKSVQVAKEVRRGLDQITAGRKGERARHRAEAQQVLARPRRRGVEPEGLAGA